MATEEFSDPRIGELVTTFRYFSPLNVSVYVESTNTQYMFDDFSKIKLPFECHGFLEYYRETDSGRLNRLDIDKNEIYTDDLTDDEKELLKQWFVLFVTENDFLVQTYSLEDPTKYVNKDIIKISEAKKQNLGYCAKKCPVPVGKFFADTYEWKTVKIIIREDGSLVADPASYCNLCYIFLTQGEWDVFPQPPTKYDSRFDMRYDFVSNTFKDMRTPENAKLFVENAIEARFNMLKTKILSDLFPSGLTDYQAILDWNLKAAAARALVYESGSYIADYFQNVLDSQIKVETDILGQQHTTTTALETAQSVIETDKEYQKAMAKFAGYKAFWMNAIETMSSLSGTAITTEYCYDVHDKFVDWYNLEYDDNITSHTLISLL